MINFKKKISEYLIFIILCLISLYFIFPFFGRDFKISFGEGPYAINPNYLNFFYIWQNRINLGTVLYFQTLIYWFVLVWKLFIPFSFILQPALIYIFFGGFFIAGLNFYFVLKNIFPKTNNLIYLPPALLYVINIYRVIAGKSDESIILFIFLPLFFLFYYRLLNTLRWKYLYYLVIISLLSSTMGKNLAVFFLPYILISFYFIFFIFSSAKKTNLKKLAVMHLIMTGFIITGNLFWILPQIFLLREYYLAADSGKIMWSFLGSGNFFDHFRFLGFWAFRDEGYFPYSKTYYEPLMIITSYIPILFSFYYFFFIKDKYHIKLKLFIASLTIISCLLVSGNKGTTGIFYQLLYDNISVFKMFRDSYAKFTPLYLFAVCFGLLFSLHYFFEKVKNVAVQIVFISFLILIIIFNAWPIFHYAYVTKVEKARAVSDIIQIPQYWRDLNQYLKNKNLNEWILVFQNNAYGSNSLWPYGINVVGNIAEYILNAKIIRSYSLDTSDSQKVIENIFKDNYRIKNLKNYMGFLNSRYILQENDLEWRYSNLILPPSQSNKIIQEKGFKLVASFGLFSKKILASIPNLEKDKKINKILYDELTNQPALNLYKMEDEFFVPLFFSPKKIIVSNKQPNDLDQFSEQADFLIPSVIYLTRQNATSFAYSYFNQVEKNNQNLMKYRPIIEYKEINPTKYRLIIHQVKDELPLVFNSNFNNNWKIYPIKLPVKTSKNELYHSLKRNESYFKQKKDYQPNIAEVKFFIDNNWLSYIKNRADFISKNFNNTIQNNNLPDGSFLETVFSNSIDEKYHLMANGYANSWTISPQSYCMANNCHRNSNGTVDIELVVEFSLQKYLHLGIMISFFIFGFAIIMAINDYIHDKKAIVESNE